MLVLPGVGHVLGGRLAAGCCRTAGLHPTASLVPQLADQAACHATAGLQEPLHLLCV